MKMPAIKEVRSLGTCPMRRVYFNNLGNGVVDIPCRDCHFKQIKTGAGGTRLEWCVFDLSSNGIPSEYSPFR